LLIILPLAVTPAKAGVHSAARHPARPWIPAFAGMTIYIDMFEHYPAFRRRATPEKLDIFCYNSYMSGWTSQNRQKE
jgi:hypothetical protein